MFALVLGRFPVNYCHLSSENKKINTPLKNLTIVLFLLGFFMALFLDFNNLNQ
jgi:hypothetical protein